MVPPLALGALHKVVVLALVLRPPGQQRKVGLQQLGRPLLQHREERLALRLREELAVAVQAERRVVRAVADCGRAAELHAVGEQPLAAEAPQLRERVRQVDAEAAAARDLPLRRDEPLDEGSRTGQRAALAAALAAGGRVVADERHVASAVGVHRAHLAHV